MADYTDEERELLISLGIAPEELDQIDKEQEHVDKLRESSADPIVRAGEVVVPNYGGIIASAVNNYRGNKENKDLKGQRAAILARVLRGRNLWDRPDRIEAQTAPIAAQNTQNLMNTPAPQIPAGAFAPPAPQPPAPSAPRMGAPGMTPGMAPPRPKYQPLGMGTHENRTLEANEFLKALAEAARNR